METRTYNVYTFDELTEEGKQKALDNARDINVSDSYWWMTECWFDRDILDIDFSKVYFSLDREAYLNVTDAIKIEDENKFLDLIGLDKELAKKYDIRFYGKNEMSTKLDLERIDDTEETEEELAQVNKAISNFDALMQVYLINLNTDWNYLTTDEAIIETFNANEYMFTEDGRID